MNSARTFIRAAALCVALVLFVPSAISQPVPLDFSTCGYASQNKSIPTATVRVVVAPQPGDNTARIQRALDHVASLAPDTNGLRGAVLLLKGSRGMKLERLVPRLSFEQLQ